MTRYWSWLTTPTVETARGWAFAQRVSDAARLAAPPTGQDEDDEYQVESPDPAIWEHVPVTRVPV